MGSFADGHSEIRLIPLLEKREKWGTQPPVGLKEKNSGPRMGRLDSRFWNLTVQSEVNRDVGVDLDRFAVEHVRLVLPFFYCLHGGAGQHGLSAYQLDGFYFAVLPD